MLVGYARASKENGQDTATQVAALKAAEVERRYEEHASGGRWDRPGLRLVDTPPTRPPTEWSGRVPSWQFARG